MAGTKKTKATGKGASGGMKVQFTSVSLRDKPTAGKAPTGETKKSQLANVTGTGPRPIGHDSDAIGYSKKKGVATVGKGGLSAATGGSGTGTSGGGGLSNSVGKIKVNVNNKDLKGSGRPGFGN